MNNQKFTSFLLFTTILCCLCFTLLRADWPRDEWNPAIDEDPSLAQNDDDDASYEPQALVDNHNNRFLLLPFYFYFRFRFFLFILSIFYHFFHKIFSDLSSFYFHYSQSFTFRWPSTNRFE